MRMASARFIFFAMAKIKISLKKARGLALQNQLLDYTEDRPDGKEGVARAIEQLGYVQIDTIAVIERAHHHTLWNRCPDYSPGMLHELQAADRRVFEYWGHAASYLPMTDYRFYLPQMKYRAQTSGKWEQDLVKKHGHLMEQVLERIRQEGPLGSKDFEKPPVAKRGTWWDWRPCKVALEILFWRGELMITERRNFQRIYDLTERVLPANIDTSFPSAGELGHFFIKRALSSYGIASQKEITDHLMGADKKMIALGLEELLETGEVQAISIERISNNSYYVLTELLDKSSGRRSPKKNIRILSPFDNLIIQRDRTLKLFGFEYSLECYTPPSKRRHGYFVLPILAGDTLIGRLDPKADRKARTLIIRNLLFEDGFDSFDIILPGLAGKLVDFAGFNQCDKIRIEKMKPAKLKQSFNKIIKKLL